MTESGNDDARRFVPPFRPSFRSRERSRNRASGACESPRARSTSSAGRFVRLNYGSDSSRRDGTRARAANDVRVNIHLICSNLYERVPRLAVIAGEIANRYPNGPATPCNARRCVLGIEITVSSGSDRGGEWVGRARSSWEYRGRSGEKTRRIPESSISVTRERTRGNLPRQSYYRFTSPRQLAIL